MPSPNINRPIMTPFGQSVTMDASGNIVQTASMQELDKFKSGMQRSPFGGSAGFRVPSMLGGAERGKYGGWQKTATSPGM